ncbi:U4/U6 small nuclear ribonucleoprotein Prp31 [Histoplasma capsulatum H143]|uniref:U4/U6 small nuclear ribonucleoprotein Prp31 n=1 Tax=Ajellomyces capsulatus (strain H143) TaxID=544712 RepID=C6H7H5_AJECH|nr:U4/U6 small nuclear ribonucleoprotein Prp31 [Histoplasma capsulatum H143]
MATLADELLNDFEESGSEDESTLANTLFPDKAAESDADGSAKVRDEGMELDGDEEEVNDDDADADIAMDPTGKLDKEMGEADATKAKVEKMRFGTVSDVRSVASLMKTLQPILDKVSYYQSLPSEKRTTSIGSIEENPEYHLLTEANSLSTSIDNEIILVHKFIRDHYSTRFPELETLITNPLDYAKTVAILQNGPLDDIKSLSTSTDNLWREQQLEAGSCPHQNSRLS